MSYATIEDVEARLGETLDSTDEAVMQAFLNDFSVFLDSEIELAGKTVGTAPNQVRPDRLKIVESQRAVNKYLLGDLMPGVTTQARTVDDVSQSVTLSGAAGASFYGDFWLSAQERRFLGLNSGSKIISIPLECGW